MEGPVEAAELLRVVAARYGSFIGAHRGLDLGNPGIGHTLDRLADKERLELRPCLEQIDRILG